MTRDPLPASDLVTRTARLVPARDGGTGIHERGRGAGEAVPDKELAGTASRVTRGPSMS